MLQVKYYLDNLDLNSRLKLIPNNTQIICPSPDIADAVREMVTSKWEVITIAKWIKNLKIPQNSKKVGKSELMLHLASAFKKYFPRSSEHLFFHSFELFTELRSFTLDLNMIVGILNELEENVGNTVKLFWAVLESQNLIDEHLLYGLMSESNLEKPICLLGFKHLSSVQIDMLKKISSHTDVYIFIPSEIKKNALSIDWVNWIDTCEVDSKKIDNTTTVKIYSFPKNKLNFYLSDYQMKNGKFDIAFLGSNKSLLELQEVLIANYNFKTKLDLFSIQKNKIFENLQEETFENFDHFSRYVNAQTKRVIIEQDFLSAKVWQLIFAAGEVYREYSPELDHFFFTILKKVVELNSPRNFFVPLNQSLENKVIDFNTLKFNNINKSLILTFTKDSSPFSKKETKYPDSIIKILKTLGPIRRGGLDSLYAKFEFEEVLKRTDVALFVEDGLLETDVGLRDVLKNFNLELVDQPIDFKVKNKVDVFSNLIQLKKNKSHSFSASKLQTFYDCPRKYYVNFIEKLDERPLKKIGIAPDEIGSLEHLIIAGYFQGNQSLIESELVKLCREKLDHHIESHNLIVEFDEYNEVLYELIEYTGNGLIFLFNLKYNSPEAIFKFEVQLPPNNFRINGFIDCIVETKEGDFIFDFKRSSASIGTKKDLISFEKLQLWIYFWAIRGNQKVVKIGYINISDIEKSQIIEIDEQSNINEFEKKLNSLVTEMSQEIFYFPKPRNENICKYCNIEMICPKENINE